ncbi:IS630 family transposase [Orientia tsutsugamushi]|nr:IS630 family transposase [Orientia tsutsugamushi]
MPEIKLNLRPNLLRLFRHLSAIILNYLNQFLKRSNKEIFTTYVETILIEELHPEQIVI